MNELQIKINSITQILSSDSSKLNKVVMSLQGFSGLDITNFSSKKKKSLYKYMAIINSITSHYPTIKTYDDYKIISDADLGELLKNVQQLCLKLLID